MELTKEQQTIINRKIERTFIKVKRQITQVEDFNEFIWALEDIQDEAAGRSKNLYEYMEVLIWMLQELEQRMDSGFEVNLLSEMTNVVLTIIRQNWKNGKKIEDEIELRETFGCLIAVFGDCLLTCDGTTKEEIEKHYSEMRERAPRFIRDKVGKSALWFPRDGETEKHKASWQDEETFYKLKKYEGEQKRNSWKLRVRDIAGLHARPSKKIIAAIKDLEVQVKACFNGKKVNAKSMIYLMTLGVRHGDIVEFTFKGKDANQARENLMKIDI